jgi:hypothetical protein
VEKPDTPAGGGNIVLLATMAGKTVNVQVTEYFPGYQCSINNRDWSPAVMFDAIFPISYQARQDSLARLQTVLLFSDRTVQGARFP